MGGAKTGSRPRVGQNDRNDQNDDHSDENGDHSDQNDKNEPKAWACSTTYLCAVSWLFARLPAPSE